MAGRRRGPISDLLTQAPTSAYTMGVDAGGFPSDDGGFMGIARAGSEFMGGAQRLIGIVFATLVIAANHAGGTVFQLGGPVNSVNDPSDLTSINVGDRWLFEYEFDTDAPPTSVFQGKATYPMGPSTIAIGSGSGTFPPSNYAVYVYNDNFYGSGDGFLIGARDGDWPGFRTIGVELELVDLDGALFSNLESPDAPFNLADLESTSFRLRIEGQDSTGHAYVFGVVDTFVAIPEPSASAILAAALVTLLCRRSRITCNPYMDEVECAPRSSGARCPE